MSKVLIILCSAFTAIVLIEGLLSTGIVTIPRYKPNVKYQSLDDPQVIVKMYPPGYEWINGESKAFIRYNHYGLPGIVDDGDQSLALCGSSFVMGQLEREFIASTIVQNHLTSSGSRTSVYNLGDGNHGPYLSFIRAALYDNIHDFDTVVLINDGNWEAQARHAIGQVFNDLGFREYPATRLVRATGTIRRFSRLLNLFGIVVNGRFGVGYTASIDNVKRSITLDGYSAALKLFKTKYGNNFIFVDISHDEYLGIKLSELCKDMGIEHYRRSLIKDDNLINGDGHLNYKGNKELGYFIYEVIQQHISNKDM
jgi:hypothetical protein